MVGIRLRLKTPLGCATNWRVCDEIGPCGSERAATQRNDRGCLARVTRMLVRQRDQRDQRDQPVAAVACVVQAHRLAINQAALTGESLPVREATNRLAARGDPGT